MPQLSRRVQLFTDSVIRRMTRISEQYDAINLSQGYPDFDPPRPLLDRLAQVAYEGPHQYSVTYGAQNLREALADKHSRATGRTVDPNVLFTQKARCQNLCRAVIGEWITCIHVHDDARLESLRIEHDGSYTANNNPCAFHRCASLEAPNIVKIRRYGVSLLAESETSQIGRLQRHKKSSEETKHNEEADGGFKLAV